VGEVMMGACFRAFLAELTRPWAPTQWSIFGSRLFWS